MPETDIIFRIEGPDAAEAAAELSREIEKTLGQKPGLKKADPPRTDDPVKVDPVAVAALVLAVPSALLAAADLVQRFKKKKQIDLIIEIAKKHNAENPETQIRISGPKGVSVHLHQADADSVIDMAS